MGEAAALTHDTLHRMCFSRRRLTVGEYRAVVAGQDVGDNRLGRLIVDLFL